ncbi:O-antigen ligase family protein [Rhodococcus opacus]|uniref:O-antigen ligase family protein n=1 Tax=Rhodococcus opacus TaxID=37919 RepID=UPI0002E6BF3F|nr:hypothetical protein [Rhodococcus opacus]CAG7599441.1 hypothetical protein E143388_04758 [Rhodococcus opacus]
MTDRGEGTVESAPATANPRWRGEIVGRSEVVTFALVMVVVTTSFLGRLSFELWGFTVRGEQVAPIILVGWLLVDPRRRHDFVHTLRHPAVVALAAFIVWNVFASFLFSPSLTKSISILAWFAIDLLLLAGLMSLGERAVWAERIGIRFVVPWAAAGFAMYLVANVSGGNVAWGTDLDSLYQVYVARLTAGEANIYASILVLWTLLLVAGKGYKRRWMIVAAVTVPLGLVGSQTRTAVFCMILGLAVYVGYEFARRRRHTRWRGEFWFGPAAIIVGVLVAYGASSNLPEFGVAETAPAVQDTTVPQTQDKLGDVNLQGGTIGFRVTVAKVAAEDMNGVNLWLGNGTNTFGVRHEQPGSPGVPGHLIMLPVQILYDVGIVGLSLILVFGAVVLYHVPWRRRPIAAAVAVSFLTAATLTSMFWFSAIWIVFAALLRPVTDDERVESPQLYS